MKVSIKDFQIIKSASFETVPGLTVILGESNNGKSALFRATKSCIYNEPGTTNVRVGCKNYVVGIEQNGHTVILQKGTNTLYLIDKQQYNKVGKTQVPEVAKALGISALNINDTTEKINFWDQMEKPFLLDRNSSDLFRFIVDSGEDDNLNTTLRSMVMDKNKLNVDKNLKEGSINTLKQQIDNMNNLLAGSDDKIKLCEDIISFGPKNALLMTINTNITNINKTTNTIKNTTDTIKREKQIQKEITDSLNTLSYKMSVKEQINDALTKCSTIQDKITQLKDITNNKVDYKAIIDKIAVQVTTSTKLADILAKISQIMVIVNQPKQERISVSVDNLTLNRMSTLDNVLQRIKVVQASIVDTKDKLQSLQDEYAPTIKEYKSIEVCPYCGNKLQEGGTHNE